MIILGIDPGIAIVGWGVVSSDASGMRQKPVDFGAITTNSSMRTEDRILAVYTELSAIIKKYKPECAAIEELFFNTNQKTGIIVAEARGAIILALRQNDVPIFEYTPLQIKNSVAGYGRADKHQMTDTVTRLLRTSRKTETGRHRRRSRSRNGATPSPETLALPNTTISLRLWRAKSVRRAEEAARTSQKNF